MKGIFMEAIQELWKQVAAKYPNWRFGYSERDGMLQLSVADPSFKRSRFAKLSPDLPLQDYANAWTEMLKELLPQKASH